MMNLDIIEAAKGGPFVVRKDGELFVMPDPADMGFMAVLECLQNEHLPATPRCPDWQRALVFRRWSAHYDLPEFMSAQRLAYLMDRYRSALVYDLAHFANEDIGLLWRARRWRTALDIIDHLPPHSWYAAAVSNDEEHAKMIAQSLAARQQEGESTESGPALTTWTPEVAAITVVADAVRHLEYTLASVNWQGKGSKPEPPKPLPRPTTPLEDAIKSAKFGARKAKHESIVARMLPHKAQSTD